uniref:Uncharacterized protein n=1 Tax=Zea mays TaxID=4577 RepID=B4FP45_MAIZE|nr:unknown [Zea mays]
MLPTTATAAAPPPPTAGPASSPSEPHAALLLALTYMRLRELLSCARTCRGLREAVAGDPLLALTDRAQGRLRSLHLLGCPRVSDAGLLRIVERNHDVTELFVPRCTGLTADGLVKIIHFLHGQHKGNLSRVRLHGICKKCETRV